MKSPKNRWLIALSAVGIHLSIGSVYAWSVFSKPLMHQYGWSLQGVSFTFSLAIIALGLSAAFMGKWVERRGPRRAGITAACFFGAGLVGAGIAVMMESLPLLYLTYGVIGGIGLGIGYIAPVSTLVKWFPDRRGLATGLAIMGFGFAAMVASPVIARLIDGIGIANTFFVLGGVYFLLMISSAAYLAPPQEGWLPAAYRKRVDAGQEKLPCDLEQCTAAEAVRTRRFYFLWLLLFINITCGIAIIAVASPMAQDIAGLSTLAAATMVGLMGIFNGSGRIGWATLSDYIGRPLTYILFFAIQMVAFALLPRATSPLVFQALVFLILTCYGGGFASIPDYIGDMFGTRQLAAIHGYILTAWAAAGYVGPTLVALVRERTNSYEQTLYIFAGLFGVALIVAILTALDIRSIHRRQLQAAPIVAG